MKTHRWAITGLALLTSLGLATAGCGNSNDGGGASSSPTPADPKQALTQSVRGLSDGNFKFTMVDHESTAKGSVHAPSRSAQIEAKSLPDAEYDVTLGFVIIDEDRWVKMDLGPELSKLAKLPKKWMHIDIDKVTSPSARNDLTISFGDVGKVDPAGCATIFKALVTAEKAGEGKYTGSVDLTMAKDAGLVDEDVVNKLGDKAKSIPFTATVDSQGRITELSMDMPAADDVKAHKLQVNYTDYGGATAAQKPPASDTIEAPAAAYEVLNG